MFTRTATVKVFPTMAAGTASPVALPTSTSPTIGSRLAENITLLLTLALSSDVIWMESVVKSFVSSVAWPLVLLITDTFPLLVPNDTRLGRAMLLLGNSDALVH